NGHTTDLADSHLSESRGAIAFSGNKTLILADLSNSRSAGKGNVAGAGGAETLQSGSRINARVVDRVTAESRLILDGRIGCIRLELNLIRCGQHLLENAELVLTSHRFELTELEVTPRAFEVKHALLISALDRRVVTLTRNLQRDSDLVSRVGDDRLRTVVAQRVLTDAERLRDLHIDSVAGGAVKLVKPVTGHEMGRNSAILEDVDAGVENDLRLDDTMFLVSHASPIRGVQKRPAEWTGRHSLELGSSAVSNGCGRRFA